MSLKFQLIFGSANNLLCFDRRLVLNAAGYDANQINNIDRANTQRVKRGNPLGAKNSFFHFCLGQKSDLYYMVHTMLRHLHHTTQNLNLFHVRLVTKSVRS